MYIEESILGHAASLTIIFSICYIYAKIQEWSR